MAEAPPAATATTPAGDYKQTLNLPRTTFDMKANLTTREPRMLQHWKEIDLYQQIRERPHPAGKWILHDGPPYANGDIHMGHLINKVLKDIVVKSRTMQGHDSPYVPGWDCHGLPIESAVQKELGPKMRELSAAQIREKCLAYAMKFVGLQSASFERLAVFGDYARPYLTVDPAYEGGVLDVLANLVKQNLVYRQKKTVHWCTFDRTALAEAELEYAPRRDHSLYVLFALEMAQAAWPHAWGAAPQQADLLIWTTTPWTLPANRAVAANPEHSYVAVTYSPPAQPHADAVALGGTGAENRRTLVMNQKLVERVMALRGITDFTVSDPVRGEDWLGLKPKYFHPLIADRVQSVLPASFVSADDGSGLVHIAPGHGADDYQLGRTFDLEIYCPVRADGRYDDTAPAWLAGQSIWDANALVLDFLKTRSAVFFEQTFEHSYPHCWRCRKPIIFRATEQWFVKAGHGTALLNKARAFVDSVNWVPAWGANRIAGMLETRPDWCISRQRSWGVPIPAFFDDAGRILFSPRSVNRIANYFREHGSDAWYTHTPEQILGAAQWTDDAILPDGSTEPTAFATHSLRTGGDILDVWFESGASHHAVLECTHPELGYPAALYLEGSDQHRGWFQASLLEAAGYRAEAPFRQVLTHGFIVDSTGHKMSKSQGNDIKVETALKEFGADVLRLWVCSVDYQNDMPCSRDLLARMGEAYRKIRNTLRYLLGNIYDFNPAADGAAPAPESIDHWMRWRLESVAHDCYEAFNSYELHRVFRDIYTFCNVDVSAVYAKAVKDRLYCELPDSPRRRATQTTCYQVLTRLTELLAPVLPFTMEEAWQEIRRLPGLAGQLSASVHLHIVAPPEAPAFTDAAKHWQQFMPLVELGFKQLDDLKKSAGLGNALDAQAVITVPANDPLAAPMIGYGPELEDVLGVGFHAIETGADWAIAMRDTRELFASCARSWKRRPDVGSVAEFPDLSARDAQVVQSLRKKSPR